MRIHIYLSLAILMFFLTACTTPRMNTADLKAEIDAARSGSYGQAMLHAELSEEDLEDANNILDHLEKDYYWNINEKQAALNAARSAAQHRLQSEKAMCQWLTEAHSHNHHKGKIHHSVAYFKTGSAVPFKIKDEAINKVGRWLKAYPHATATITASTDTIGRPDYNQRLSEERAKTVVQRLVANGAKLDQLIIKAIGEAAGVDETPNQEYRVVTISAHGDYIDCPHIK